MCISLTSVMIRAVPDNAFVLQAPQICCFWTAGHSLQCSFCSRDPLGVGRTHKVNLFSWQQQYPTPARLCALFQGRAQSLCRDCPEGTFCSEPGLAAPQDCPKGHFCPAGSPVPLPCAMVRVKHGFVSQAAISRRVPSLGRACSGCLCAGNLLGCGEGRFLQALPCRDVLQQGWAARAGGALPAWTLLLTRLQHLLTCE